MSDWTKLEKVVGTVLIICILVGLLVDITGNYPRWSSGRANFLSFNSVPEGVTRISILLLILYGMYMYKKYSQSDGI